MEQQTQPKFNPFSMALSNAIIPGAAYLTLHLYGRFLTVYPLAILLLLLRIPFAGNSTYITALNAAALLLWIFIVVDVFIQAKKISEGKKILPAKVKALNILGVFVIIFFVLLYAGINILTMKESPYTPSLLEEMQKSSDYQKARGEVTNKYQPLTDDQCEQYASDASLIEPGPSGMNYGVTFANFCYFRKAVETKNPLYCHDYYYNYDQIKTSLEFNWWCIAYVALESQKPELCEEMLAFSYQKNDCNYAYQEKIIQDLRLPRCGYPLPEKHKERCEKEFGQFVEGLKYE